MSKVCAFSAHSLKLVDVAEELRNSDFCSATAKGALECISVELVQALGANYILSFVYSTEVSRAVTCFRERAFAFFSFGVPALPERDSVCEPNRDLQNGPVFQLFFACFRERASARL